MEELDSEALEVRGRILLWQMAFNECEWLLQLSGRAWAAFESPERHAATKAYLDRMQEHARAQAGYNPNLQDGHVLHAWQIANPEPFPTLMECVQVRNAATMLAIVIYCQPFIQGHGHTGVAAASSEALRENYLEPAIREMFPDQSERQRFDTLRETLIERRNFVLGHAFAKQFDIEHGDGMTKLRMFATAATEGIDVPYWMSTLKPLSAALVQRMP